MEEHRTGGSSPTGGEPAPHTGGPGGVDAEPPLRAARESGLVRAGEPLLVLLSGGADSVCLLHVAASLGARAAALHVNHGLRPEAADEEALCRSLCERLGVPLTVESLELRASTGPGNLQAEARTARYALAERHAEADYAAAHTATDQAETVLYRLATSPGRTALLGMEPRRGRLVRPLLGTTRAETQAWCAARELQFVDDPTNADARFARSRVRHQAMPALRTLNPAAERTIVETSRLLRDEAEVLDGVVEDELDRLGRRAVKVAELQSLAPGLGRLVLRRLAEEAAGGPHPLSRRDAQAVLDLAAGGGSASLDLGGGLRAVAEYGTLRFVRAGDAAPPDPVPLPVPGSAHFGAWEVVARPGPGGEALLSGAALGPLATLRSWRDGDRMRPVGLGGTKSLQDLFTDRKVPRELRRTLPVLEARGEIAWVAGVAVGEGFRAGGDPAETVSVSARRRG